VSSTGQIYKISTSPEKGLKKVNIETVEIRDDFGIVGDAHAGSQRQISLLPFESFDKVKNDLVDINPGDFAENITTIGLDFSSVKLSQKIKIGNSILLEITQIGKECHHGCYIREVVGDCIMPREGIFACVLKGGTMNIGDKIEWWDN
jgi:MOSC domain-containing protein YiiM